MNTLSHHQASAKIHAHNWFFPAAALYAAIVLPLSLQIMLTQPGWLPGLATGLGHGHEMLFGFALAVIAGYLLGPQSKLLLGAMLVLWAAARASYLTAPYSAVAALTNALFAVLLAVQIAPKFMTAAKKWRNKVIGPVLLAICGLAAAMQLDRHLGGHLTQQTLLHESVLLIALLLLFVGGRIIAPAVAGHFQQLGQELDARVQPRVEGALIIAMGLAIALHPWPATRSLAAIALVVAGVLALVRLLRWRLWQCRARPDLLCLGAGYGWLVIGLILLALAAPAHRAAALHVITIGGLGSLALGVMARTRMQRVRANPADAPSIVIGTALIGLAAAARALAGLGVFYGGLLWLSTLAWALAFLLLARLLFSLPAR